MIAYRNGAPVLLRDIGRAVDSVENAELAAWYNGAPAVILDIQRQPGANTIQVVEAVRALLPKLTASLPPALKISVVTDRTTTIRAAIADVQFTLVLTVVLVVVVIFLFLRKLWATVIPSIALPVSLVATFGGMAIAGYSLDNLSLMALTIASGFVVDDAIVMIENITRYVEAGETPLAAALKGARQIGGHADELPIDESSQNEIVFGRAQAIPDRFQSHGLMLGHGISKGQRLPLQRLVAQLSVGPGIAVGKAANLHCQS